MKHLKKLTILHSNDLHGDFLAGEIDGMRVLFIGILTEDVLASTKNEDLIGTLVDIQEAAEEV